MQKINILTLLLSLLISTGAFAQDYLFFTNSDNTSYYDPSYLYANSPSTILAVNSVKFPVNSDTFYSPTNSLKLQWKPMTGGDWGAAIAAPGWPGRDVTSMDSVKLWVYATANIPSAALPKMFLEDLSNQKTAKISLSNYHGDLTAGVWTVVKVPMSVFKTNPGSADLTRIKVIYLGQSIDDGIQRTIFIDEVSITGNYNQGNYKNIVVLGSSTSAGIGPSTSDSAWVNRFRKNLLAQDTSYKVVNLAIGGYTTYHIMPTGFTPPGGRPNPAVNNNITFALTYTPVAVLINMPSNDATNLYPITEQIANYDTLVKILRNNNISTWISTTQPRNFSDPNQTSLLKAMRDSTYSRYGQYAVDFWTTLADTNGWIVSTYNSGDGIHLNDAGHRILYERMRDAVLPRILPVELASFTARNDNKTVLLQWSTTNELNNKGFVIERSINNSEWQYVDFLPGAGTTDRRITYYFTDYADVNGTYSYRLKQIDFDGSFEYSAVVSVDVFTTPEYSLSQNYPNPFNPSTSISYSLPVKSAVSVKVYNIMGSEVVTLFEGTSDAGTHKLMFDASGMPSGIYFYTIRTEDFTATKKMTLIK
ncbi:MAG: T9SS type A sorting domain-containing protein [Ignavibacteriaceae bacterium]|nr:T9SS type A sorting domain-containing protein [Ignavibacteriaceae bacterium]